MGQVGGWGGQGPMHCLFPFYAEDWRQFYANLIVFF